MGVWTAICAAREANRWCSPTSSAPTTSTAVARRRAHLRFAYEEDHYDMMGTAPAAGGAPCFAGRPLCWTGGLNIDAAGPESEGQVRQRQGRWRGSFSAPRRDRPHPSPRRPASRYQSTSGRPRLRAPRSAELAAASAVLDPRRRHCSSRTWGPLRHQVHRRGATPSRLSALRRRIRAAVERRAGAEPGAAVVTECGARYEGRGLAPGSWPGKLSSSLFGIDLLSR